jgi:antitoxin MazE
VDTKDGYSNCSSAQNLIGNSCHSGFNVYTRLYIPLRRLAVRAKAQLTVQTWGNSLAVRIPSKVARSARLVVGQSVAMEVVDGSVVVTPEGKPKRSLAQLLRSFDPAVHGGEIVVQGRVGKERF